MIPNFRDVGETVNIIYGSNIMKEGVLFRGGSVNNLFDETELPAITTILNLRIGQDKVFPSIHQIHIPAINAVENYETHNGKARHWANKVLNTICYDNYFPLLIHCTLGRDRTGVIIALILLAIEIEYSVIIEEYMQTSNIKSSHHIQLALVGFGHVIEYIYQKDLILFLKKTLKIESI